MGFLIVFIVKTVQMYGRKCSFENFRGSIVKQLPDRDLDRPMHGFGLMLLHNAVRFGLCLADSLQTLA